MGTPIQDILGCLEESLVVSQGSVRVKNIPVLRSRAGCLAEFSALGSGQVQNLARYLTRAAALELGIYPASIHDLYMARGRGEMNKIYTVPAINLRVLTFDAARAVFRAAKKLRAGAFIFEIARSEMGYTEQRPSEFATSVLAAAIAEGHKGPVFLQGDHFQVSAKRYLANSNGEVDALRALIRESIAAGFYNIDIDTSTMVDLNQSTAAGQQVLNTQLSALFTTYIRSVQPTNLTISIGGEIGEVGGHNSTEEELRAYLAGYNDGLNTQITGITGLSKVSIQTGTSHGGMVLADGSIAQVDVDFDTMQRLSRLARDEYGLGGAVQHGASTLPEDAFGKFVEAETLEVHLATNFMNMFYDRIPDWLRGEMYAWLAVKFSGERKEGMTDEQFFYKTRKNAIGPFKRQAWGLPEEARDALGQAWEAQFIQLFTQLNLAETRKDIDLFINPVMIPPVLKEYMGEGARFEDISDLAD